jgi:uncharacterized membrane protein HdeD (DUF308 family)
MANTNLPSPRQINPTIDSKIDALIMQAMQVMPEKRYQNIADMLADLTKVNLIFQAKNAKLVSGKTSLIPETRQPIKKPERWQNGLLGIGAILIGIYTLLLLDFIYDYTADAQYYLWILATYYLFFSGVTLAGLSTGNRWRALPLISGLLTGLTSLFALTLDHPTLWVNTFLYEYPAPFMVLGGAIILAGCLIIVYASENKNWSILILGFMSIMLGASLTFIDYLYEIYFSIVIGSIAILGGILALVLALRE